ncbi:harmonin-binding protein USHBP1 [Anolis carolinensis]|uniref:harmonin-binding protein USHBP1 n=1 Tax=Anolis carolinensis TaxID=28377 RepID=UPI002F2B68E6
MEPASFLSGKTGKASHYYCYYGKKQEPKGWALACFDAAVRLWSHFSDRMEQEGSRDEEGSPEKALPPDEREALRCEERITALLVTVSRLHQHLQRLEREKDREQEEEEFSDLCSEYTASLPRCSVPFLSLEATMPPPEKRHPDLFLAALQAVSSLENAVSSHRNRRPSAGSGTEQSPNVAENFGESPVGSRKGCQSQQSFAPNLDFLSTESIVYRQEVALCRERKAALEKQLGIRNEELQHCKGTLLVYEEERDRLRRKVKELQEALAEEEGLQDTASSPLCKQDPVAIATQKFLCCVRNAASIQPTPGLSSQEVSSPAEINGKDPQEEQRDRLHRSIRGLQELNRFLRVSLEETKGRAERISLALGRSEAGGTALRLAVQYSENCLEAYEALLSLMAVEREDEGGPPCAGKPRDSPHRMQLAVMEKAQHFLQSRNGVDDGSVCSEENPLEENRDRKKLLRGYIRCLKAEQRALKLPPCHTGIEATEVEEAGQALQVVLPSRSTSFTMEKEHLLQELQAAREALADLKSRLHLAEKEKECLGLQTYTLRSQEAAFRLMVRILQEERDELQGKQQQSLSSGESSPSSSDSEEYGPRVSSKRETLGKTEEPKDPEVQAMELQQSLLRQNALRSRLGSLLLEVEEQGREGRDLAGQEAELARDLLQAHSALGTAFRNARLKQEAQVQQLERQVSLMGHRHALQLQSLVQTLQDLGSFRTLPQEAKVIQGSGEQP